MGVFRLLDLDTEEISSSIVLDQATVVQCDALKGHSGEYGNGAKLVE